MRRGSRSLSLLIASIVMLAILLLALPLIISGSLRGRGAYDSVNFHEPTIRVFARDWPRSDFSQYLSATTPLYHWLLAGGLRITSSADGVFGTWEADLTPEVGHGLPSEAEGGPKRARNPTIESQRRWLQILGLGFSLAWLGGLATFMARRLMVAEQPEDPQARSTWLTLILIAPLVCSPYVLQSAIWLLPDNLAWGLVCLVLCLLCVMVDRASHSREQASAISIARLWRLLALLGITLVILVLARQIHIWIAGVIWAALWMIGAIAARFSLDRPALRDSGLVHLRDVLGGSKGLIDLKVLRASITWWMIGLFISIPAALAMLWFYRLWNGQLVPPGFEGWYPKKTQWATMGFALGLLGVYGVFFIGWWMRGLALLWRSDRLWILIGAGAGFLAAGLPQTYVDNQMGRFGGIWSLIDLGPTIAGREIALLTLSTLGGVVCVSLLRLVRRPVRWVLLAALAGFVAAQSQSWQLWQRYHEAYWLMWIMITIVMAANRQGDDLEATQPNRFGHAARVLGPLGLAGLLLAAGVALYQTGRVEADEGYRPGVVEALPGTDGASPMLRLKGNSP